MSFNWDSIDTRQQKAKKDAKELKDFLTQQHEEAKKRFLMASDILIVSIESSRKE